MKIFGPVYELPGGELDRYELSVHRYEYFIIGNKSFF